MSNSLSSLRVCVVLAGLLGTIATSALPGRAQTAPDAATPDTAAPEAVAPALDIGAGEIQFVGQVAAVDAAAAGFTLNVRAFTLPSGKTSRLAALKAKAVSIGATTFFQSIDGKRKLAVTDLKAGVEVLVTGKDLGTGKPLPARLIIVDQGPPVVAAPATPATPAGPGEEIRAGEIRLEGSIEGILATNSFLLGAISSTGANGKTREFEERESWNAILPAGTAILANGSGQKFSAADLKLRMRVAVVGAPVKGEKTVKAREVVIMEDINTSRRNLGSVSVSGEVAELLTRSDRFRDDGLFEKSIPLLNQAVKAAQLADDGNGESLSLNRLGAAYEAINQPKKAVEVLMQAVAGARQRGNASNAATSLVNLAGALSDVGLSEKAIEAMEQSLALQKNLDEKPLLAHTLINLGSLYADSDQHQKAQESFERAIPLFRQVGDKENELEARRLLLATYSNSNQYEKALQLAEQLLPMIEAVEDKTQKGGALLTIGLAYADSRKYDVALDQLRKSLAIFTEVNSEEM